MRIFIGILVLAASVFTFLLFEGICFRMVEKYASFRLEKSWGTKLSENFNKYLKFLPLNHFAETPSGSIEVEFSSLRAVEEDEYASEVMSFGRPTRDFYSDFITYPNPNSKSFRIKDVKHIAGLKFPGLERFPTDEEVAKGWSGRKRDKIEYAKALFVELRPFSDKSNFESRNEDFLLEHGIACLTLPVRDKDSLVNDLHLLKNSYPAVCQKIICSAHGNEADILLSIVSGNPFLVNLIIVNSPTGFSDTPKVESFPWFFCILKNEDLENISLVDGLLGWVNAARDSNYIYPSKIGGLLRIKDSYSSENLISFHIPLIMECISFYDSLDEKKSRSFALKTESAQMVPSSKDHKIKFTDKIPSKINLSELRSLQSELPKKQTSRTEAFDCEMVRLYRELHIGDESVAAANNRELILKIGSNFERQGDNVMEEVKGEDPLFYHFYNSLKIIEAQSIESVE